MENRAAKIRAVVAYGLAGSMAAAGVLIASRVFFPLKKLTHWDEVVKGIYPGIDQMHYKLSDIFSAVSGYVDDGQLTVFLLRIFRNIFLGDHGAVLIAYKALVLLLTVLVIVWFIRNMFEEHSIFGQLFIVVTFLIAPMTWIQANEVMAEPISLPLCLIWFGLSMQCIEWPNVDTKRKVILFVKLVICTYIFLLISYKYLLQSMVTSYLGLIILETIKKAKLRPVLSSTFSLFKIFAVVMMSAAILWFITHWTQPLYERIYFFLKPITVTFQTWSFSAINMSKLQTLTFGLRNFAWLYFPAIFLLVPAAWVLISKFKEFPEKTRFVIIASVVGLFMSAYAFRGNLQPRYYHLANCLFLFIISLCMFHFITDFWKGRRVLKGGFILLSVFYLTFEYMPIYGVLPSLANMQIYGTYDKDMANADDVSAFFSLIKRRELVDFPQLRYKFYYPNREPGKSVIHVSKLTDRIKEFIEPGLHPLALDEMVFYNKQSARLQYLEKFGSSPPPLIEGEPILYINLSFPPTSAYNSVYYSEWGANSEERAERLWKEQVVTRPHKITYVERANEYTIQMAKAAYVPPPEKIKVDWSDLNSIRMFGISRLEDSTSHTTGRMGCMGNVLKWFLNHPILERLLN